MLNMEFPKISTSPVPYLQLVSESFLNSFLLSSGGNVNRPLRKQGQTSKEKNIMNFHHPHDLSEKQKESQIKRKLKSF